MSKSLEVKQWACPTVLVLASREVQKTCADNGVSFTQLLKPFGFDLSIFSGISVHTGAQDHSLQSFGLRFVSPEELVCPEEKTSREYLLQVVKEYEPTKDRQTDGIREEEDVPGFLRAVKNATPWFSKYHEEFLETLRFNELEKNGELLDHPVAMVIAASSRDPDPVALLESMRNVRNLPVLFKMGIFNSNISIAYILVHDHQSQKNPAELNRALQVYQDLETKLQTRTSMTCLVELNAVEGGLSSKMPSGAWDSCMFRSRVLYGVMPIPLPVVPNFSSEDVASVRNFVSIFIKFLLPQVEKRLRGLNEMVKQTRSGLRNQIKLFFGRRESKVRTTQQGDGYDLASAETQIRLLADTAFLMQDYEMAVTNYRLLAHDYKTDKMWGHFAGAQEMIGLCAALGYGSEREACAAFELAFTYFAREGDARRACRSALWAVDYYRNRLKRPQDATDTLLKASEDNGIRGALLLEQAAYTFLEMRPPQVRKYAFHLVMAGHLYQRCQLKAHTIRCYTVARDVYEARGWFHIDTHIHHSMARVSYEQEDFASAVKFLVNLIGVGADDKVGIGGKRLQTAERQTNFMREFKHMVKKWAGGKPAEVPGLKLPSFQDSTVEVLTSEPGTVPAEYAKKTWDQVLTRHPTMSLDSSVCNRALFAAQDSARVEADRSCPVNERVLVRVRIHNPLQITITIKGIHLGCMHESEQGGLQRNGDSDSTLEAFEVDHKDLVLNPGASTSLVLSVKAKQEGTIHIEGVRWRLEKLIKGFHRFELPPKRVRISGGLYELRADASLHVPISGPMPLLVVAMRAKPDQPLPTVLLHGAVCAGSITLTNQGAVPLRKVAVKMSHPGFGVIHRPAAVASVAKQSSWAYEHNWQTGEVDLGLELAPGQSIELPFWLRGTLVGDHTLGFLFHYESPDGKRRLAYHTSSLLVKPFVKISVSTRPCFSDLQQTLFAVEVEDQREGQQEQPINFSQVCMRAHGWKLLPLRPQEEEAPVLSPEESASLFFRVEHVPEVADEPAEAVSQVSFQTSGQQLPPWIVTGGLEPPLLPLVDLEKALMVHEEKQKLIINPKAKVAGVGNADRISVMLAWSTADGTQSGVTHVPGLTCMKPQPGACALKVQLEHPPMVEHDFAKDGPLCVPVTISVRNRLQTPGPGSVVSFLFETLSPEETFDSARRSFSNVNHSSLRDRYTWQGSTRQQVSNFPKDAVHIINLYAWFYEPCLYNLNRFKFTVAVPGRSPRVFFFPLQHLLLVKSPSSNSASNLKQDEAKTISASGGSTLREDVLSSLLG